MTRKYPAVFVLLFVVLGIVLADQTHWSSNLFLLAAAVPCLIGLAVLRSSPRVAAVLFGLFMLSFSAFHFGIRYYDVGPDHLTNFVQPGRQYEIFGRVADWPELKSTGTDIKIAVDSLGPPVDRAVTGAVLLKVSDSTTALQRGDRVHFRAPILDIAGGHSPGGFDYRRFLRLKGVSGLILKTNLLDVSLDTAGRSVVLGWVDRVRALILASFQRNLSPSGAALASGFLIGETRDIPPEVYQRFRDSGTLHLLAVSGSNVVLVLAFVTLLLRPLGLNRRLRSMVLLGVILVFALLCYGEPSVVRASIMASLVIGAGLLQRRYDLNNIIAVAALAILLYDPAQLFDVGFQLSFVVAWGIIYVVPKTHQLFEKYHVRRWYKWLVFPVSVSLVAQLCAAPLTAFYFHRIPLISPLANLVIVPLVSLAVVGSLGLLLADLVLPLLGALVGSVLDLLLQSILRLLDLFGGDLAPVWKVAHPSWIAAAGLFFVLVVGVPAMTSRRWRRVLVFGLVGLLNLALVDHVFSSPPALSLHLFNIPGGVCGVFKQSSSHVADMVITGAVGRRYQLDDKILAPALTALDIDRLSNLIVLSAEFGAIDDIRRLGRQYHLDSLYVAAEYYAAFEDVRNQEEQAGDTVILSYFDGAYPEVNSSSPGWYLGGGTAELDVGRSMVIFADGLDPALLDRLGSSPPDWLVVGRTVDIAASAIRSLTRAGKCHIIAPRFRGRPASEAADRLRPDSATGAPGLFIELNRLGAIELRLQNQSAQAFQLIAGP